MKLNKLKIQSQKNSSSLLIKIPLMFISLLLISTILLFILLGLFGKKLLQKEMYDEVRLTGIAIINRLDEQIGHAETLAITLAEVGEELPQEEALHLKILPAIIDYNQEKDLIAGGGLWPEPYLFDKNRERRSFFWGRNQQGVLEYYDDYNNPQSKGYHHEEWYVPVKYIQENQLIWSKSYIDPYSQQPMVTVSAPMYQGTQFYGVSTIDLKLSGLKKLLHEAAAPLKGYAFALDRNGKVLSFPDELLKQINAIKPLGKLYFKDLAQPEYPEFNRILETIKLASLSISEQALAEKIAQESYQINFEEAAFIAVNIDDMKNKLNKQPIQFIAKNDFFLQQSVLISVVTMPKTAWKIILVTPLNSLAQIRQLVYSELGMVVVGYFILLTLFILGYLYRILIAPLRKISTANENKMVFLGQSNAKELQQLANLFNQRSQQLIEVSRSKSEFLSNMSHEFRTPLNAIMGFSQLLENNTHTTLTTKELDYVHHIYNAGEHLSALISSILEFSKMEAGKIEAHIEAVNLNLITERCLKTIQAAFKDTQVTLINQLPKDPLIVTADERLIYQVLLNLLSNAIKYNRPDGTVTIKANITADHIKISVTDTGYGISDVDLKKLFQPFERLSAKNTKIPGNGIGLSFCEKLVALMEGRIGVDTVVDKGSTFWVELKKSL